MAKACVHVWGPYSPKRGDNVGTDSAGWKAEKERIYGPRVYAGGKYVLANKII
jgi:hypothetical protein